MGKRAAVLFSGGKDSALALHKALQNNYNIRYLLCVLPENKDSYMYHKPDEKLLRKQAEMLDIELITKESNKVKEKELKDLKDLIKQIRKDIDVIVIGGIASSYQAKRIKTIVEQEFGLKIYAPLWDYTAKGLWKELIDKGFKIILTKIACEGIDKEFLGRIIDDKLLDKLISLSKKFKFRLDFEGGEAESAVLFMPEFKREIKVKGVIRSEEEFRYFFEIEEVK